MANESDNSTIRCDAVVIGAGFSGVSMLYRLRKLGLSAKIFEAGEDFGGTWHWNRYPGARVDSEFPFYQLNIPELATSWTFKERYPDHHEIRAYFAHADRVLGLRKDTYFNSRVADCAWDDEAGEWTVKTGDGKVAKARYLMLCAGLLHQQHTPDFPGLKDYKGRVFHSSAYPQDLDVKGKRVALVGTGATAVQITQELAKEAERLTIFMRRPSLCLPAVQRSISLQENYAWQAYVNAILTNARKSPGGFLCQPSPAEKTLEVSPEEREKYWRRLLAAGAFHIWNQNYADVMSDREANAKVYEFWAKTVRSRMTDERKMDLMAPLPADKMPYHIFTKRPPLEVDYYEMVDKPSVDVINTNETPTSAFNEKGILMEDGRQLDFDVLVLATGFDSHTGSVSKMGLKSRDGVDMKDHWKDGIRAYLGMTFSGYPNTFMVYTPLAPTALSNGTAIIEAQCDFACAAVSKIRESERDGAQGSGRGKIKSIEALSEAEDEWARYVEAQSEGTLFPLTRSWWNGANIPGKKPQQLNYLRGLEEYEKEVHDKLNRFEGFDVRYWDGKGHEKVSAQAEGVKNEEMPRLEHVETTGHGEKGASEAAAAASFLPVIAVD